MVEDSHERIFYDGTCGMCHWLVRFVTARDRAAVFRMAPLQGRTCERLIPPDVRAALPDSVVVLTKEGRVLTRSDAVLYVTERLGGVWRAVARLARAVPRGWREAVYRLVARWRYRVFGRKSEACPLLPPELAKRLDP